MITNSFHGSFWGLLLLCGSLLSCTNTPQEVATEVPKGLPILKLSDWQQQCLNQGAQTHVFLAEKLYWLQLPKVPTQASFYADQQLDALAEGSRAALRKRYQQVRTNTRNKGYSEVKHLDLSEQNIHYIPNKVAQYSNLRYLSLRNNKLKAVNPKLAQCKRLKKLDLSSNGLSNIPFGLIYLTQLEALILSDNALNSLPSYLSNLRQLKMLDLSNAHPRMALYQNIFRQVPSVVFQLPKLERLFLEKLPLRKLPSHFSQLHNLRILSLNGSRGLDLYQVVETLARMPNLVALDLSFIGRRNLPSNMHKLKHLSVLIWHEEKRRNESYIKTLEQQLPNTKIFYGKRGIPTPFLRGNTVATLKAIGAS